VAEHRGPASKCPGYRSNAPGATVEPPLLAFNGPRPASAASGSETLRDPEVGQTVMTIAQPAARML